MTLFQIAQKSEIAFRLDGLQLLAHGIQIGRESQLTAVIEDQMIRRVDALKLKHFTSGNSQLGELGIIQQRHHQQSRAGIEVMSIAADAVAATTGLRILFQHSDMQSALCQPRRRGNPAYARADDDDRRFFHFSFPLLLPGMSSQ